MFEYHFQPAAQRLI